MRLSLLVAFILLSILVFYCLQALAITASEHFQKAVILRFNNQSDAAIAEYRRGLEQEPNSINGHAQLGLTLMEEKGDLDGAMSELMTALSIDPESSFCQLELKRALDLKNSKVSDLIVRGNQFYGLGLLGRAAAYYRIAVTNDSKDSVAHNSLAWTLYRLGILDEGVHEVEEALRLKPDDPEYVNTLACLELDQGRVDDALSLFHKAISLSKKPGAADLYGIAIGLLAKGDEEGALQSFKEAIKTDPRYRDLPYVRDTIGMSVRACASHDKLLSRAELPASK